MPRDSHQSMYNSDDRVRLPVHIVILLAGVILLFVGGGAGLVYSSLTNHMAPPQNSPTPQVHATTSATAHTSPTTHASPTAQATPTLQASPTISAVPNPYPPHTGNLALNDPLKDNSKGYNWDVGAFGNGGSCSFTGGSYHVSVPMQGHVLACNAEAVTFSNLTYEVQMTILKGDRGGIFFRQIGTQGPYYYFSIKIDGSYELDSFNGNTSNVLQLGTSPAVNRGLNQQNLLAVVAQGSSIDLYVNGQSILHITASTTSSGLIGVAADATDQPAEVAFNNTRVWML
jgi:eukaryotic-like serine/threonine-protein kinase